MNKEELVKLVKSTQEVFNELEQELDYLKNDSQVNYVSQVSVEPTFEPNINVTIAKLNSFSYKICRGEAMLVTLLSKLEKEEC